MTLGWLIESLTRKVAEGADPQAIVWASVKADPPAGILDMDAQVVEVSVDGPLVVLIVGIVEG